MRQLKLLSAVMDVLVLGACVTSGVVTLTALPARAGVTERTGSTELTGSTAAATTAPSAPRGWTTVFQDAFAGRAGSAPPAANWFYDIGSGYGTGEIERTTSLDTERLPRWPRAPRAEGDPQRGTWTSARIESTRDDYAAPAGGELEMTASIEQPRPGSGSRVLAGVLGARGAHAGWRWLAGLR